MKEKRVWRFFSIAQQAEEEAFLREMHKAGWKLRRVSGVCVYHFARCAPEDVVYQLDYNPEGLREGEGYRQVFRDCGWEFVQGYMDYAYFRKPASAMRSGDEAIFSDENSRLEMLGRVLRRRGLPLALALCALLLGYAGALVVGAYGAAAAILVLLLLYVYVLATFLRGYWRLRVRAGR